MPGLPVGWEVEPDGQDPAFTFTVGTPTWRAIAGVMVVADPLAAFATCGTSLRSGDELLDVLTGRAGLEVDGPHPATVGRLGGVRLDLVATADVHVTTCGRHDIAPLLAAPDPPDGTQHYHPMIYGPGPSERMRVYLLDAGEGHTIAILMTASRGSSIRSQPARPRSSDRSRSRAPDVRRRRSQGVRAASRRSRYSR